MLVRTIALVGCAMFKCFDCEAEGVVVMTVRHKIVNQHADVGQNQE